MPKKSRLKVVALLLALIGILSYPVIITVAKLELGGTSPNEQVYAKLIHEYQRANGQYCTGIHVTPESTWLIGRIENNPVEYFTFAKDIPNLEKLLYPSEENANKAVNEKALYSWSRGSSLYQREEVSFISKLDKTGTFKLVAVVPDVACLQATPDGRRVYLFTGLDRPKREEDQEVNISQSVIFQSDDQGKTWQWRKEGFFPTNHYVVLDLKPYFFTAQSVWSWGNYDENSILKFSPDGGKTVENVIALKPFLASRHRGYGDIERHIVQISADKAIIWVSQRIKGQNTSDGMPSQVLTHRIPLMRNQGKWQAGKKTTIKELFIEEVIDNRNGKVIAHINLDADTPTQLAFLNLKTLEWQPRGELPSTFFGLLTANDSIRSMHVSQNSIVIKISSVHEVPRWIYPWDGRPAYISARAYFYSTDWGESWEKLDIDSHDGVLGMGKEQDKVLWANPWYKDSELAVRSYDLNQ
jgi:hypothetical protein